MKDWAFFVINPNKYIVKFLTLLVIKKKNAV